MKVIDLDNKIIFTDDIQYIYSNEKTGEYYNSTVYYIVTKVGKFEVDKYEYAKVKEYLLSLNDEEKIKDDEYIELSNKYQRLLNRNEELEGSLDEQRTTTTLLARRIIKSIKLTEELYKIAKEQDSDNVNLIDRLEIILKTLKGE